MKSVTIKLPNSLNEQMLDKFCNIDNSKDQYNKTYQYIKRSAKEIGLLIEDNIVLKLYHMMRENEPLPQNLIDNFENFLRQEIQNNGFDLRQKVGFAILSQGFVSINIWGRGNVLFTTTYTIEKSFPNLSKKTLEQTGVACTWEIRIMEYEYKLWQEYLESSMKNEDKRVYLSNFISGELF